MIKIKPIRNTFCHSIIRTNLPLIAHKTHFKTKALAHLALYYAKLPKSQIICAEYCATPKHSTISCISNFNFLI